MRISDWSSDVCSSDLLPTRFGLVYMLMLIGMLVGSINYTLSLGFVVTFLLAGMGTMAMLHTWRNLAWRQIESRRRSEERRGGKEGVSTCRSRWSPSH